MPAAPWAVELLSVLKAELSASQEGGSPEQLAFFDDVVTMIAKTGASPASPVRSVLTHVGSRWGAALLITLNTGPLRFGSLRRLMKLVPDNQITQRMLTLSLRMLERDGFIVRTVHQGAVTHVEYALTPAGRELSDLVWGLIRWLGHHSDEIETSRARYDRPHQADGK